MVSELTNIWKYNPATGSWTLVRDSYKENAPRWMEIFQGDEPDAVFKISKKRPVKSPKGYGFKSYKEIS